MLENLKQLAVHAHYGTSFSPEKRGESLINEFEQMLSEDLEKIKEATNNQKEMYISKFKSLLSAWLGAKSRCLSSMIAGPSNFPVRRAEKANRSEHNRFEAFMYWRGKAIKAIIKSTLPESDPLADAKRNLESRVKMQEYYKLVNATYRAWKKNPESILKADLSDDIKKIITNWTPKYSFEKSPIQGYIMTNNLANIKRIEQRVKELEAKEVKKECENKDFTFASGVVSFNYSIDKICIKHNSKPERSVIDQLKRNGFHWSPSNVCWMRQITPDAIYKTETLTGLKF
jgi:hypothetical protein